MSEACRRPRGRGIIGAENPVDRERLPLRRCRGKYEGERGATSTSNGVVSTLGVDRDGVAGEVSIVANGDEGKVQL